MKFHSSRSIRSNPPPPPALRSRLGWSPPSTPFPQKPDAQPPGQSQLSAKSPRALSSSANPARRGAVVLARAEAKPRRPPTRKPPVRVRRSPAPPGGSGHRSGRRRRLPWKLAPVREEGRGNGFHSRQPATKTKIMSLQLLSNNPRLLIVQLWR